MNHSPEFISEPLYRAKDVKKIELSYCQSQGFQMYELMERAGKSACQFLLNHWPDVKRITVVCGNGNNAGDGMVLARLAIERGMEVQVLSSQDSPKYQGDALTAYTRLKAVNIDIQKFDEELLVGQELIVDTLLGTGIQGVLRDNFKNIIESINQSASQYHIPVFSLDIPSGLYSDTGDVNPVAIVAHQTLTFITCKTGLVTAYGRTYCGEITVADLGINQSFIADFEASAWVDDEQLLISNLPKRSMNSHKGDHGHLLLIGGDYGFGGAILMSAMAAARAGVGMITILTRDAHVAPLLTQCPEAMIRSISGAEDPALTDILSSVDAVVIGPGLGQEEWGQGLFDVISQCDLPLLIDADALNILSTKKLNNSNWVMTPHPGEASRLLNCTTSDIQHDRYQAVRSLQKTYSGVVVLKGAGTLICADTFAPTVNKGGNPGMATAGMGDVLSGIIGSLLAQGIDSFRAARTGVALHSLAGDMAAEDGQKGLMATDLIEPLRILVNQ